ncbi:hypothetical protein CHS0354_001966 [Potamilus streckersoni]|uniref:Uncharacterized protein n=1 Tax=Potamilus streckersoni TaxID=2493646 RepID=A0AAE0T6B8_9BIVA|nr:hypothetical protein CHS0354_001966 [Potamilus streckersoni]
MLREILSVTTKIAAFMTYHLELHKYRRDSMTDEEIVQFIIRIDQIGIEWDNCLNRYLSYCKVIDADKDKKEVDNSLHVLFIIPENTPIDCILPGQLLDVISTVFELTCGLLGYKDKIAAPEIIGMEGGHSLYVNLKLPTPETAEVAGSFLHFLNTENIASEQMTLHGLETLRLKIGSSVTSAAMKTRAKKLILLLKKLPAGAYFSVQNKISSDDIMVISRLCRSIEEMKQTTEEGQPAKINTSETANTGTSSHIGASTQSGSSQNSDGQPQQTIKTFLKPTPTAIEN